MRLVGVAEADGSASQVNRFPGGVDHADEAVEAQDALEGLGAVADRRVGAAAELAFAETNPLLASTWPPR
ncbi:MAG TPA: hypothetical protein VFO01_13575 [Trebonia sp.]|nr:hypothetical protein [Trebonia sp.]